MTLMQTTTPRPSRSVRRAHDARILALLAEQAECRARNTPVGSIMAANVGQDIVNIGRAFAAQWGV